MGTVPRMSHEAVEVEKVPGWGQQGCSGQVETPERLGLTQTHVSPRERTQPGLGGTSASPIRGVMFEMVY